MGDVNRSVNVFFNEQELTASLQRAQQQATRLEERMKDIGDKSTPEFQKLKTQLDSTTTKIGELSSRIDGKLAPSIKQMTAQVQKCWNELNTIPVGTSEWKAKLKEFDTLNSHLIKVKGEVGQVGRAFKTFGDELKTVALGVFVGNALQAGVQAIQGYFTGMIQGAAKLSDELSDIQKTTGLTNDEVKDLNSELSKIDTRTSRSDLRGIAAVGGQFNVAKNDLVEFTQAVDIANVALGDEFGGGAENVASQLSKLRNIFTDIKSGSIDEDLLHIGNALNALGNDGAATSDVVADFSNRIAGVGIPLGLTTDQVLGISATLQELGVNAERGGTAVSKILQKMTVNVEDFAKVAGVSTEDFTKLLNTDLYKAFTMVVEGSTKAGSSATAMAHLLKDAELSGAGAAEVFLKLSSNTQLMGDKVALAGDALKNTNSLMQEFDSKNNNAAASLEKINKRISAMFSGFSEGVGTFLNNVAKMIEVQDDETKALEKTQLALNQNLNALKDVNLEGESRKQLIGEINEKYGEYLPNLLTEQSTLEDINTAQALGNKLLQTKIFTIAYEKELTEILKDQKDAIEGVVRGKIAESKINAQGAADVTGLSPAQTGAVTTTIQNIGKIQQAVADGTDKRIQDLQEKFKRMAEVAGVSFEEIANGAVGTLAAANPKVAATLAATGNALKDVSARLKKEMAELGKTALSEMEQEYQAQINVVTQLHEEQKLQLKESLANSLITEEEYKGALITSEISFTKVKLDIANEYKDGRNKATEDAAKLELSYQNQILDEHIRVNNAIADADEQSKNDQIKNAKEAADARTKENQKQLAEFIELSEAATAAFKGLMGLVNTIWLVQMNKQLSSEKEMLDKQKQQFKDLLDSKQISQEQYNRQIEVIEAQKREKEKKIKQEQFAADKAAKIIEATIATALAVVKALPNIPLSVLAGFTGAATIATIAATPMPEFEHGGSFGKLQGPSHSSPSRGLWIFNPETNRVVARAEGDEYLNSKKTTSKYYSLLEAVNRDDSAAINKWFLDRPQMNYGAVKNLVSYIPMYSHSGMNYDDEQLRDTIHQGNKLHIAGAKYIVDGIVSGIGNSSYAKSRRL